MRARGRRNLALLFFLALFLGLAFQGSRGLYETTEGRYAEAGREMLETGNWWIPQLDYEPHWTKPPLTYWTIASGIAVAGPTELGARLGNALTFPLVVLAVAWLGSLLWDERTGLLAGLVYATSLFPVVAASTISTDLVLTLWEVLGAALYWRALRERRDPGNEGRESLWILAFWIVAGLAFLTKGPPALLTLLAVLVFHGVALRKEWTVPKLGRIWAIAVFLVVGFGWYLDVVLRTPGLLSYFIGDEVFGRIATDQFHRNPEWYKPPFVYGLPLLLGLGGWLFHLGTIRRGLRAGGIRGPLRRMLAAGPVRLFLALWILLPLVILTLSQSRLPLYVLPFFAVLPLVAARGLTWAQDDRPLLRTARHTGAVMVAVLLLLKAGSAWIPSSSDMSALYEAVEAMALPGSVQVVAVNRDALYGLQYYLEGDLDRVRTDRPGDETSSLEHYLSRITRSAGPAVVGRHAGETGAGAPGAASDPSRRYVFVARSEVLSAEELSCEDSRFDCRTGEGEEGWDVWLMEPASPSTSPQGLSQ